MQRKMSGFFNTVMKLLVPQKQRICDHFSNHECFKGHREPTELHETKL
jgi:hypothetical protein